MPGMIKKLLCEELKRQLAAKGASVMQVPAGGALLWEWFTDLSQARTYGGAGPNPITFADIVAYSHIMRWPIEPRHAAILMAMDRVYLDHAYTRAKPVPDGVKTSPLISGAKLSPGAFDAMFGG